MASSTSCGNGFGSIHDHFHELAYHMRRMPSDLQSYTCAVWSPCLLRYSVTSIRHSYRENSRSRPLFMFFSFQSRMASTRFCLFMFWRKFYTSKIAPSRKPSIVIADAFGICLEVAFFVCKPFGRSFSIFRQLAGSPVFRVILLPVNAVVTMLYHCMSLSK